MRHIIDAIAAQGRDKDTELLHVTKNELAGLDALKRHMSGSGLTKNPRTGIPEAGFFDEYVLPALPAVAGLAAGAVTLNPVVGAGVGAAVGAGTKAAQGGTTQDALLGGVMGGIAGYGAAGIGSGLAEAGGTELAKQGAAQAVAQTPLEAGASQAQASMSQIPALSNPAAAEAATQSTPAVMQGATNSAGIAGPEPTTMDKLGAGIKSIGTDATALKGQMGNAGTTAMGTYGLASMTPSSVIGTGAPTDTSSHYKGEVYYDANGFRRTRAVPMASGGQVYGQYEGVEEADDGGYAPGGGLNTDFQAGIKGYGFGGFVESLQPGGAVGQLQPGRRDWERKQAEEAQRKQDETAAAIAAATKSQQLNSLSGSQNYAIGGMTPTPARSGIANLGFAKGRYLQGPGDGMSDSIPANIDGKQEARLATGEFVVPADVVSHLGNGDSSAGAKQLHSMMDRARMARTGTKQQGKQINPKKVMPV